MNKKSIIQIIVLFVLLLVGAGVYLMQQDGGLDFLSYLESKPEPPPVANAPPARKPTPPKAPPAGTIPAEPAKGEVNGKAFRADHSTIEDGTLTLRQGAPGVGPAVSISLPVEAWQIPVKQNYKFDKSRPGAPAVRVTPAPEGQDKPYRGDYTLILEFGEVKNDRLPGKILLTLPETAKTSIAGTFDAEIKGFRIVNGKPDLGVDSNETLEFLALREMLKDDPDKPLKDLALRDARYARAGDVMSGYLEASYRIGDGAALTQRFQFVKESQAWRVLRTLRADQIDEAHPVVVPGPSADPAQLFPYLAARRIEADMQKKSPNVAIYIDGYKTRHSDMHKLGQCEVSYRLAGSDRTVKTTYLFRLKTNGWTLERALGARERVNFDTGKIERG